MATYSLSSILGQTISFSPASDILVFTGFSSALITFEQVGNDYRVNTPVGSVILAGFSPTKITPTNFVFADLSSYAIGDLSTNDTLDAGSNTIDFTTNPLLALAVNANNLISGQGGSDTIKVGDGDNIIYGGKSSADSTDGGDSITVGVGSNIVYGNGGDDVLNFTSATVVNKLLTFYGGYGNDSMNSNGATGTLVVYAADGTDVINITSSNGANTVYGGSGTDTLNLTGSTGTNLIYGGNGASDSTDGGDTITLGTGNTTLYANGGADIITLNAGSGKLASIYAGAGNDTLTSAAAAGTYDIYGGSGNDNINLSGHTGSVTVYGGMGVADPTDGADTITSGTESSLLIYSNGGADVITITPTTSGSAVVYSGAGNDTITASAAGLGANVQLIGGTGNDTFKFTFPVSDANYTIQDFGTDTDVINVTLSGSSAADIVLTQSATGTLIQRGVNSINLLGYQGNFSASNFSGDINSLLITNFNGNAATLTGAAGNDQLIAGNNGDSLIAGAGSDKLTGGNGNDTFSIAASAFSSADTISGGGGNNTLSFTAAGGAVADSAFTNTGNIGTLKLSGADFSGSTITLGTVAGAAGISTLDASALTGTNGTTVNAASFSRGLTFLGANGVDNVTGSTSADSLSGGAGNDVLTGGVGIDTLVGGAGNDVYVYNAAIAAITSEVGDRITDFDAGTSTTTVDTFRFSAGALNYNIGDNNNVVVGATVSSIAAAGGLATELVILNTVGIATASITASLDVINSAINPGKGVIDVFFDTTKAHGVIYYDNNGSTAGGHILIADIPNLTTLGTLLNVDFNDFSFV